jgi:DNA-binding MarR family transcriptional regulator
LSRGRTGEGEYLTDAEFRAWHGALQFTNRAMRAVDEALSAAHDISITEFDVLITLFNASGDRLRMTELAERVVLTPSGLTHLVTRLERKGLLHRVVDPDDRRSFFAELTRAGRRRLRESRATHNAVIRARLTRRLTAKQLATMGSLFAALGEIDASSAAE